MSKDDIFEGFTWHSSIGVDYTINGTRRFIARLPATKKALSMFVVAGKNLLIHKTTRCLWRMSDDKKFIEPVFSSDVLTEEDVKAAMEEDK